LIVEKLILNLTQRCVGKHIDVSQISREGASHGRMDNRLSRGISTYPLALTPRRAQIPESQRGGT